ncbi:hermansky-pudlak syndrome protein [Anaeramoeba ignava]|uniref:Hermansky-pudlak syndrome protein n=1 Tax=Anaeramoeba ignava TaxID=1746090 RepID=A0A9Q0REV9_ANAIG|nr:hermansky-pudlak syndrome protein [Anaeramoeba ignava]
MSEKHKFFVITNRLNNPIYLELSDFKADSYERASISLGILTVSKNIYNEFFQEELMTLQCTKSKLIFEQFDSLFFVVISDNSESDAFLRKQLVLIKEILLLKFGPIFLKTINKRAGVSTAHVYHKIKILLESVKQLSKTSQFFLVQSNEKLDIPDIKFRIKPAIDDILSKTKNTTQALLFVGSKLLLHTSLQKFKNIEIESHDIFLLVIYLQSVFNEDKEKSQLDSQKLQDNIKENQSHSQDSNDQDLDRLSTLQEPSQVAQDQDFISETNKTPDHNSSVTIDSEKKSNTNDLDDGQRSIENSDKLSHLESTTIDEKNSQIQEENNQIEDENSDARSIMSLTFEPDTITEITQEKYEALYFRTPDYTSYNVYSAEISESVRLVLINEYEEINKEDLEEETAKMKEIAKKIQYELRYYFNCFLPPKITMTSYIRKYPGIVHFIFVDRKKNNVVAPEILPLHTGALLENPTVSQMSVEYIKSHVWNLFSQAQSYLMQGFATMLLRIDDFYYSYRIWFEDEEGFVLPLRDKLPTEELKGNTSNFYSELIYRIFRKKTHIYCYELYSLYVGVLAPNVVSSLNDMLSRELIEYF